MAGFSEVKIANLALSRVGTVSTIESFSEESSEAKQVSLWYDYSRIITLEAVNWTFARKRQSGVIHSEDAPEGIWTYRYQYPADAVTIRYIANTSLSADKQPFEIEMDSSGNSKTIVCDVEDAVFVYTYDNTIVDFYPKAFISCLAWRLAADIAYPITRKQSVVNRCEEGYFREVRKAAAQNYNEEISRKPRDAEHIRERQ